MGNKISFIPKQTVKFVETETTYDIGIFPIIIFTFIATVILYWFLKKRKSSKLKE